MIDAGIAAYCGLAPDEPYEEIVREIYRAMAAASPLFRMPGPQET